MEGELRPKPLECNFEHGPRSVPIERVSPTLSPINIQNCSMIVEAISQPLESEWRLSESFSCVSATTPALPIKEPLSGAEIGPSAHLRTLGTSALLRCPTRVRNMVLGS